MRLLIATRNKHKVEEIRSILGSGFEYASLADFPDAPEVHEDADTFEGNARKKAVEIAAWLRECGRRLSAPTVVLADDSGLEVDALGGAPGVVSARYAGKQGDTEANNRKLLEELKTVPHGKRTARFRCVIAIANTNGKVSVASGACEGHIIDAPRGNQGFGYDPLFVPNGHTQTFAELGSEVKDKISHRARALEEAKKILVGAHGRAPNFVSHINDVGRTAVRPYNPSLHHRRSIRRWGYDYSQTAIYFVTICSQDWKHIFGQIVEGQMVLNNTGQIVQEEWLRSPEIRKEIRLHEWVVMPNHLHGLVEFVGAHGGAPDLDSKQLRAHGSVPLRKPRSLASFIAGFKAATTKRINESRGTYGTPAWQRNYFEHVVRNEEDLHRIRQYILTNPQRWEYDRENAECKRADEFDEWLQSFNVGAHGGAPEA